MTIASAWWAPVLAPSQLYGCTDLALEGHNPNHPECAYFHEGIDFPLPCGTPIHAGRQVTVTACDPPGYGPPGNTAAICLWDKATNHDVWMYHMQAPYAVPVGAVVKAGQLIGYSGTRGYSTGCHVHFEVRPHGAPYRSSINPISYLEDDMTPDEHDKLYRLDDVVEAIYKGTGPTALPVIATNLGAIKTAQDANTAAIITAINEIVVPAPVIDTTALAAAIVAGMPSNQPPVAPQAVKDWWAQITHWLGLA